MKFKYVLRLAKLCLILSEIHPVSPVIPICLTWKTTNTYLIVECSVLFATHDIFIVDQFGITRGQCISADSWNCSGTNTHDLSFKKTPDNLTRLKLTINRDTAEGEWKCRHGNDERTVHVSYLKGDIPMIDIEVSKDTQKINESNIFKLTCSSCKEPDTKGVDIYINGVLKDNIRYESGLCYHKRRLCTQDRCSCLARGNHYTWTFISNLTYIQFTCSMRFRDAVNSPIIITKAHILYNGSVIVKKKKKNESIINQSDKNPENHNPDQDVANNSGYIAIPVVAGVCLIFLIIAIACFWRMYKRRRNQANENNEVERIPLQEQDLIELPNRCNGTETTDKCLQFIKDIINDVSGENSIDKLAFYLNACEQFEEFGFKILKGLGVEVEENRVSFHMKEIQSLGEEQCSCLRGIIAWLFRGKSFRFLRLYDVGKFNLNDLQLNKSMYEHLYKIFEVIIVMKSEKSWYHYRRNGLTYKGSSEGAFMLLKNIFLNMKFPLGFQQFSSFESRLETFYDYPIETQTYREKLANAGFFYFHVSDYVQCHNCGGCLRDWNDMQDPLVRHTKTFQTCNFAMARKMKSGSMMTDGPLIYVGHQKYEDRLTSFKSFPDTLPKTDLEQLALAGFYYCGIAKDIECCACNIEFSDIENTAYILKQHKNSSPECQYTKVCENQTEWNDMTYQGSSCEQYLELERRSHDCIFQNT